MKKIRILYIHNHYLVRGGEDQTFEDEVTLMRSRGHDVGCYITSSKDFVNASKLSLGVRTIWAKGAYSELQKFLHRERWDIVHVHNFFPFLSPAIFYAAQEKNIPTVLTLHNYRLLCTNATLYRNGQPCERCLGRYLPWRGIFHSCYPRGRLANIAVAGMVGIHRLLGTWTHKINKYIVLTPFGQNLFIQNHLPKDKLSIIPTFVDPDLGIGDGDGHYALFVGRHSQEKGIRTLISAWRLLEGKFPLRIAGSGGPLSDKLSEESRSIPGVEFLGRVPQEQIVSLMQKARILVFPSEWYEGTPRTIVESFACGTPVLASNLGAMTCMIEPGKTGLFFKAGDPKDLASKITKIFQDQMLSKRMRSEARSAYEKYYTAEKHYERLMHTYLQVMDSGTETTQ